MTEINKTRISKFLSLVLRHQPEVIGLALDEGGWADVAGLLGGLKLHGEPVSLPELEEIVHTNPKRRFALNEDHSRIRANQGHSIEVALQLDAKEPPEYLYHGTVAKYLAAIKAEGMQRMSRQHVHLSGDSETTAIVAARRGKPVVLTIGSGEMHRAGVLFYQSENGVWLVDAVPLQYIDFEN